MTRDGAVAARMAHNHEVPGSSPGPATRENQSYPLWVVFIFFRHCDAGDSILEVRSSVTGPSVAGAWIEVRCPGHI